MEPVKIVTMFALQHGEGKQIVLPENLVTSFQGQQFLRVKATSATIVNLICPTKEKNASLAASSGLAELLELRNKAATQGCTADVEEGSAVFDSAKKKDKAPKSHVHGDRTVEVQCDGTPITFLWQGSMRRPSRNDLMVLMNEDMLSAVFKKIKETAQDALNSTKRAYSKKRKAEEDK